MSDTDLHFCSTEKLVIYKFLTVFFYFMVCGTVWPTIAANPTLAKKTRLQTGFVLYTTFSVRIEFRLQFFKNNIH